MITLALSKGRIFTETLPFLAAAGIYPLEDPETSRKLIIGTNNPDLRIVVVRASDVPTYVQYGAADMGVAGKDSLYVGVHVDLIKLYGSMELAPISGLSDAIVDLVSTGATLKANNLVEVETIDYISSRLIVGSTAMKLKRQELLPLIEIFANTVKKE